MKISPTDDIQPFALEQLPIGVLAISIRGRILYANPAIAQLLGYETQAIIHTSARTLFPDSDFWCAPCIPKAQQLVTAIGQHRQGNKLLLQARITPLPSGGEPGVVAVLDDVTALKRAEEELRASKARFAGILEIAEDAIVSTDSEQRVILFNQGAEKIFGYSAQEILGQPLDLLLPERSIAPHRQHMEEFARSRMVSRKMGERREIFGRRKDGAEFPAEASISRLEINGQMVFTAMLRDVTERKRNEEAVQHLNDELEQRVDQRTNDLARANRDLEQALVELQSKTEEIHAMTQQLWQAAKLASVGELAASIAHELNNPLATVSLRVESLLAQTREEAPARRLLEVVEQEVERMGNLVGNLLQFSRRGHEQVSTVDIGVELGKALELVQYHLKKRRIEIHCEFSPASSTMHADRQKLRQVFLNLLTNASDAMPEGGTLTLRARPGELDDGRSAVVIEFSDTGVGIAPDYLKRVMEPFFTTKEEGKGTGLGLAICRRVAQEHHGTIQIESTLGKGTTVRLTLPTANPVNVEFLRSL